MDGVLSERQIAEEVWRAERLKLGFGAWRLWILVLADVEV